MKIKIGKQEVELRLTSLAVERIEDEFDCALSELFAEGKNLKAKEYAFMIYCMTGLEMPLDEFKKEMSKNYTYVETMGFINEMFKAPNVEGEELPAIEVR
jgi:hypothetical protein